MSIKRRKAFSFYGCYLGNNVCFYLVRGIIQSAWELGDIFLSLDGYHIGQRHFYFFCLRSVSDNLILEYSPENVIMENFTENPNSLSLFPPSFQLWFPSSTDRSQSFVREHTVTKSCVTDRKAVFREWIILGSWGKSWGTFTFNTKECWIKTKLKFRIRGEDHKDIWEENNIASISIEETI